MRKVIDSAHVVPSRDFPLLIRGNRTSYCCGAPMFFVQSMDGGYVTLNCFFCNKPNSVSFAEFLAIDLTLACMSCTKPMIRARLEHDGRNYGFECNACGISKRFAEVLPHYKDLER